MTHLSELPESEKCHSNRDLVEEFILCYSICEQCTLLAANSASGFSHVSRRLIRLEADMHFPHTVAAQNTMIYI